MDGRTEHGVGLTSEHYRGSDDTRVIMDSLMTTIASLSMRKIFFLVTSQNYLISYLQKYFTRTTRIILRN